ncbi:uncharacterized protein LOC124925444 [Impatiens glandulifera]|uniref:uncharacterized protein LOC124925444 n=1 Tax=Impatiens glandulifera TaxID=253017 RepID=UPI001FB1671C|nr:uncharacterized protein LOC124925444 [Impatiens glandulifera]
MHCSSYYTRPHFTFHQSHSSSNSYSSSLLSTELLKQSSRLCFSTHAKISACQRRIHNDDFLVDTDILTGKAAAKGSGTTARGRRLLKIREDKRKRDYDRLHNYPAWAKVLEDACKNDEELRAVLGDSIGNPELMRKKVEERVRTRGPNFNKSKTGSVLSFKVSFRDFNLIDSYIWFELYGSPSDREVDLIGSVIQSWYVMGRLGAFNSSNLQLGNTSMEYDPLYDEEKGFKVMPSSFHDIGDVEFQDNWGRVWVDLGTSDFFAIDVLLNCLTVLSSEYLGIQQIVFGGSKLGDWEEGMTSPDYGYKYFKI